MCRPNKMGLSIEKIEVLLLVAAVVAMLARRLRVPYSIGLVVAGVCLLLAAAGMVGLRFLPAREPVEAVFVAEEKT